MRRHVKTDNSTEEALSRSFNMVLKYLLCLFFLEAHVETSDATTASDATSVSLTEMATRDQSEKENIAPSTSAAFTTESMMSDTTTVTTNTETFRGTTTWNVTSLPVTISRASTSTEEVTSPLLLSDKVTTESTTMSKIKTTENDIIPPVTTRSFSTHSFLESSLSSTTPNLIIKTTTGTTTPPPSTEKATTKSTIEDTTFPKTTPNFYVSSVMTTKSTTKLPTTTTAPKTTHRPCPQPNLFTHGSYEIVYESSPLICPVIDINAGSSQLNCFRIYSNGYVKEGSFAFYYEPHRNYFSKWGSWILAPYMADLATGPNSMIKYSVYSKYTYNGEAGTSVLNKLGEIDEHMKTTLTDFQSVWAIVITWENVRPRSLEGETWENYPGVTFQMVIVTNGKRTYLLYLYKPCGMDMGVDVKAIMGYAGGGKYYIHKDSMKINSLVNIDLNSNTGVQGEWMFDISGWYQATKKLKCLKCVDLCWLYLQKRPIDFCEGYRFPFIAFTFGDPHIQTFDGFTYSFNGLGEYVYLDVYNRTTKVKLIEVQARTQLATNVNGTKVNATIFSAFAMKNFETNTTAQVEMSDSKKDLIINLDNQDLTLDFQKSLTFKKIGKISVFRKSNASEDPKASFTFSSGIDITVSVSTGMLSVSFSIPEDLQKDIQTRGLQGDIDGDPNNDLRTPNGTVLSVNSTEEEIFDNFGQLWLINQSLFTYPAGQTKDNYIDKSFRPLFLDKTTAKYKEAVKVCDGEKNIACIYDFIATENKALAQKTQADAKTATEELAQSKNRAPVINGEKVLEITVNKTKKWEIHVTDKDNDTVRIQIQDGKEYINVINNGYNFTLNILIPQLTPVNISIIAIDEKNQTSGGFTLKIVLCSGCSGNGQCSKDNSEIDQQFYEQLRCTCDKGYEGKNCETDYDGCAENPCVEAKYCQDLSPEVEQATNRTFNCSCPPGYLLQKDNRCLDKDECKSNATNECESFCNNTEGSYFCSCAKGYELKNKTKCVNNISTTCTKNCSNADGCEIDKCFCNKGFELNNTDFCVDINECNPNPCEYKCENTKGSFYCTCPNGKKVIEKIKCEVCDDDHWGINCSTPCDCQNNAECNPEKGCICQDGWKGTKCSEDINECDIANNCTNIQKCINKNGSYDCECIAGYQKEGNGCVDINECQEGNPCTDLCVNTKGSYVCKCRNGYSSQNGQNCTDIDECQENLSGCEQICNNNEGSYICNCFEGYKLNDDRQTCSLIQQSEACKAANCTKNQFCKYSNGTGQCLCKNGYEFDNTTKTCTWIDLCKSNPYLVTKIVSINILQLTEEFKSVPGFIEVIINKISAGSVLVDYSIITKENSLSSLNEKLDIIKNNGLKVFNETVNVLSTKSFVCTKGYNTYLAIGLGIGIPLLVIIILILVKFIWFRRKNSFAVQTLNNSDIYNTQESFGSLSVFHGKRLRINDDFTGDLRTNAWEDNTYDSATPGYYLSTMLERQGSFRINRPKLY
ncbi:unnamed protein product [Acanthosepion pharaonis]|uniref:Mucin-like protein n=1 Tax=Acanthosepion pharaonis TaxID=158019 RepID=A0A812EST6_ACAPH|nr:unnamed protein product [Sepia pharaonis]